MAPRLTIPLTALRPEIERGWPPSVYVENFGWFPGARWLPNGSDARADLEQPPGSELVFRLRGLRGACLRTAVSLLDRDPGWGLSRVSVLVRLPSGRSRTVWRGTLGRVAGRPVPVSRSIEAELGTADEAELILRAAPRVRWAAPTIELACATREPAAEPQLTVAATVRKRREDEPLISILMPVHNPPPEIFEAAIESVRAQTFGDWELCLADDGSTDDRVRQILARCVESDERMHLVHRERAGGISAATNSALEIARGEYIALLDHDDTLVPDALQQVAGVLAERPETDWVYSHEDVVDEDVRVHTYLKPGWSPELLLSQMYTCHLGVYRRALANEIGGFRSEFDGSQDYDFALRFAERTEHVASIPRVLYHWRAHSGSVAGNPHSKPGAYPAARRAIEAHLERRGIDADVHFGFAPGLYRVVHRVDPVPRVGVAVSAAGAADIGALLYSLADPAEAGLEPERIAVASPDPTIDAAIRVECGRDLDGAGRLQLAASHCLDLDFVVLIDEAVVPLTRGWLRRLVGFAAQSGIGAVGAKLTAVSGLIENAGEGFFDGVPLPLMTGSPATAGGPLSMALMPSNVSAVSGVLATSGAAFRRLSGLDPEMGGLVLSDYCLRARKAGLRTVLASDAILRRPRGTVLANDLEAFPRFVSRWRGCGADPYFDLNWGWPGAELSG